MGGTLIRMAGPDLSRRVERAEEDVTAISDTVLEIKETVDRHTETLEAHGRELAAIRETQSQHGEVLAEILRRLDAR
ncbi:hypothetical protein C8E95_7109 [Pseudonocardia autotrophica]|uniref:Uncharacterized protein n=3 Tax=Pseudonocardiaceae TaxID=2070 RepID=A0A1Y2MIE6_PSEAH|nr:hypothetical protein BG845_06343 [Pseudonocardia autotrophica]TDN65603.1 hypothetical protein C8E95_7109 [Pseudonocardia autotrophica]BBG05745.1 hypothetical protein Pdca_69540 [Pseudonocardia autotrophica]GEC28155.1 hypothetical protein PSA01_51840 [Pseudonocardia saturnea]